LTISGGTTILTLQSTLKRRLQNESYDLGNRCRCCALSVFQCGQDLQEYERGVVFRLGRIAGARGPGLIVLVPLIDTMKKISLRTVVIDVPLRTLSLKTMFRSRLMPSFISGCLTLSSASLRLRTISMQPSSFRRLH
jgi:hypothetical protein